MFPSMVMNVSFFAIHTPLTGRLAVFGPKKIYGNPQQKQNHTRKKKRGNYCNELAGPVGFHS